MDESEIQIPSYFLCPISLQIMRDPVTLPTGITYDRESIEHWLYSSSGHNTCPVTKQTLPESDLTPNHTLRRLIQSWCSANSSFGIQRFPTPRPPIDKAQISSLLAEDSNFLPKSNLSILTKLKQIVSESERNKRCVEATPGAIDFLASFILTPPSESELEIDESVSILYTLQLSQQSLRDLLERNQDFLLSLTQILRRSANYQSRAHAVLLIKALVSVLPHSQLIISTKQEFFEEIVKVLRDRISYQAMKAALQVLYRVCPLGRNTVKAVKAGAVNVLIDLLLDEPERKACEMMIVVLDELCGCAEGREEVVRHAAGIAVVSKKVMRVSVVATDRAVRVLYSILLNQATPAVVQEMLELGVVSKLCLLLQMECEKSTRKLVKEMLRMHINAWRRSPCLKPQLSRLCIRLIHDYDVEGEEIN